MSAGILDSVNGAIEVVAVVESLTNHGADAHVALHLRNRPSHSVVTAVNAEISSAHAVIRINKPANGIAGAEAVKRGDIIGIEFVDSGIRGTLVRQPVQRVVGVIGGNGGGAALIGSRSGLGGQVVVVELELADGSGFGLL